MQNLNEIGKAHLILDNGIPWLHIACVEHKPVLLELNMFSANLYGW